MGVLFISCSSPNTDQATDLKSWLQSQGYGEAFVDLEPGDGVESGRRFRDALIAAGERCSGVLLVISDDWLQSTSCQLDLQCILELGKAVFPVQVASLSKETLPDTLKGHPNLVDLSTAGDDQSGKSQLGEVLRRAGLRPSDFDWPPASDPERPTYRGLSTLDDCDAAIFFGRCDQITKGMDALRRMRAGQKERVLSIVGRSGAGKSSFLRAGLLSRLRRDEHQFAVLPMVTPSRDPLRGVGGLWPALSLDRAPTDDDELREHLVALRRSTVGEETSSVRTLVLPIDPADELLAIPDAVALLRRCVLADPDLLIVLTLSDNRISGLDGFDRSPAVCVLEHRLPAMSFESYMEMIERPGGLNEPPITVFTDLARPLSDELAGPDALPLLAFTIQMLLERQEGSERMDLGDFQRGLGGISGSINAAVTTAYERALRDPLCPTNRTALDELARSALIPWLVQIDSPEAPPKRRVAQLENLPAPSRPLIEHLADQNLLTVSSKGDAKTVEVTHAAVLRNWWGLTGWIREERLILERVTQVKRAAEEWDVVERSPDLLVHRGDRLKIAESLLERPDLARSMAGIPLEYLEACRANETQRHQRDIRRQRRRQSLRRMSTVGLVLLALVSIVALAVAYRGVRAAERAQSIMLAAASTEALEAGRAERAMRIAVLAASDSALSPAAAGAQFQLGKAAMAAPGAVVLPGRAGAVLSAAYAPDASAVATGAEDGTARVWRREDEGRWGVSVLRGHTGAVRRVAFSSDGARVVTASDDRTAKVWRRDGRGAWSSSSLAGHTGPVHVAVFVPGSEQVLTASREERVVRLWRSGDGGTWVSERLEAPDGGIESLAVSGDGSLVAAGAVDGRVWLWTQAGGNYWQRETLSVDHRGAVTAIGFSSDGAGLLTASADHTARVLRRSRSGSWAIEALQGHTGPIRRIVFGADRETVATAGDDGAVRVWRRQAGDWRSVRLDGHESAATAVAFSKDGLRLVTGASNGVVRLWSRGEQDEWRSETLSGHEASVIHAEFAPEGGRLLTASVDGTARLWPTTRSGPPTWVGHAAEIQSIVYAPDGSFVVTGARDGMARVWSRGKAREGIALKGHEGPIVAVAVSPASDRIATASSDGTARVWVSRLAGVWTAEVLKGHEDALTSVAFLDDGTGLVTGSKDRTARVWRRNANGGWSSVKLEGHATAVAAVSYSPGVQAILTTSQDGQSRVWQGGPGIWRSTVVDGQVGAATFAPDGSILTGGETPRIWRFGPDGAPPLRSLALALDGATMKVDRVDVALDGSALLTSEASGAIRIWTSAQGDEWQPEVLRMRGPKLRDARFLPDGKRILTVDEDTVQVWRRGESGQWLTVALPKASKVLAVAVSPWGDEVLTASEVANGDRPAIRRWNIDWLRTDTERDAGFEAADKIPPLVSALCADRLNMTVAEKDGGGPSRVRRPLAEVDEADLEAVPVLRALGLSVGDDVCRSATVPMIDGWVSRAIPRRWWPVLDRL